MVALLVPAPADPADAAVDAFDCGDDEVNNYFRKRLWFRDGKISPPTYEFRLGAGQPVVGYVSVAPRANEHPTDESTQKAKYLVIYAIGVNKAFQGQRLESGESYAAAMVDFLGTVDTKKKCIGLYLWVRSDNARAIAFYKKVGFEADPGGPRPRFDGEGAPHLTMRKLPRVEAAVS